MSVCDRVDAVIAELEDIDEDCESRPLTTAIRQSRSRLQRGVNTARHRRTEK